MQQILFLSMKDALAIHEDQISRYGGLNGIRSTELLESAINEPQASFDNVYLYRNIYEMAACYLFGIIKNHPFVDGNKRTGIICATLFLRYNDIMIQPTRKEFYDLALEVASSKIKKKEIVQRLESFAVHDA